MKILILGASGMVGQGVLRECLLDDGVGKIVSIVRRPSGASHAKLHEIMHVDFSDFLSLAETFVDIDACCFCLGVSAIGCEETEYRRVTKAIPVTLAMTLLEANPRMRFLHVSAAGADRSGRSRAMWARVKGETENALLAMPFRSVHVFRPFIIQPGYGIVSRTRLYRWFYGVSGPLLNVVRRCFPHYATSTERIGKAMLRVAKEGSALQVLESVDINALASL